MCRKLCLALLCQLCLLVVMTPVQAEKAADLQGGQAKERQVAAVGGESEAREGIAYYYARRYQGRKTSSGERYDRRKLTAAHPTLPLGTKVKVVNLANDRSVVVKVNDRCRKRPYEIIDLSEAAARQLGLLRIGKARVRIAPVQSPP